MRDPALAGLNLDELVYDEQSDVERLTANLVVDAYTESLVDVAYATMDSPIGQLVVAATERGVVRVSFAPQSEALQELADAVSPRVLRAPRRMDEVLRQLDEYFAQRRRSFDLPLDLQLSQGFRREVLDELRTVPYGTRVSYAQLAALARRPAAVRAVGSACALNPIPVVIPCHRVIRSDGTIGNYVGGAQAKAILLDLEGT